MFGGCAVFGKAASSAALLIDRFRLRQGVVVLRCAGNLGLAKNCGKEGVPSRAEVLAVAEDKFKGTQDTDFELRAGVPHPFL